MEMIKTESKVNLLFWTLA